MAGDAHSRHNKLAPELLRQIVHGTLGQDDSVASMLTLLESVAFGCIEMAAQLAGNEERGRHVYLDAFVESLTERVASAEARDG